MAEVEPPRGVEPGWGGLRGWRRLKMLAYCAIGGCLFSTGSFIAITGPHLTRNVQWIAEGQGGWGAVADAGIKGGLFGGLLGLLGVLPVFLGIFLYNRGRKLTAPSATEILRYSTRSPVLYLRTFDDDSLTAGQSEIRVGSYTLWSISTQEEQIVDCFQHAGPVVAVGRPGEKLPELGAARVYLEEHEWKAEVSALIDRAHLTVIRAGTSEGVLWEIGEAVARVHPYKLVILIPFDEAGYKEFATRARHFFPRGLPTWPELDKNPGNPSVRGTTLDIKAIVYFDAAWNGTLKGVEPTKASERSRRPLQEAFAEALQPVHANLGIQPVEPLASARAGQSAMTIGALVAGLIPGVLLAAYMAPTLGDLVGKVQETRFFAKTRTQRLAGAMPGPWGAGFSDEINQNEVVRTWVETASQSQLQQMGDRIASGLPRLSDDLLNERAVIVSALLRGSALATCAAVIRLSAGKTPGWMHQALIPSQPSVDLLTLIERHLGPDGIRRWVRISVKSLEADVTNIPARRVTQDQITRAAQELVNALPAPERERMIAGLQRYAILSDEELCWVERTIAETRVRLRPASSSTILRAGFGTAP
jgi:hypothetical protein